MQILSADKKGITFAASYIEYEKMCDGLIKFRKSKNKLKSIKTSANSVIPKIIFQ